MNKYLGTYRICCEWDRNSLEPIKEDTYIQCAKDGQIYRISDDLLAYYKPRRGNSEQFSKKLIDLGVNRVKNLSTDGDVLIQFSEESLDIVAKRSRSFNKWRRYKTLEYKKFKKAAMV